MWGRLFWKFNVETPCGGGRCASPFSHPQGASMAISPRHSSASHLGYSATGCYGEMFC